MHEESGSSSCVEPRLASDASIAGASNAAPQTLLELLAHGSAGKTAVILPERNIRITYAELRRQVQAVAEQLAAAGVRRGDRVGIALSNGLPMIVAFLAAAVAGTAAPLNPLYKEDEFRFYLEDTAARVLILPPDGADEARRAAGDRMPILSVDMDGSGTVTVSGVSRLAVVPPEVDDVALVLHTSGSTGRPKRVPLSHANLSISAGNVARCYTLGPDDVSMCVMPLFHAHGLGIALPISIDQRMAGAEKVGAHKTSMLQDYEAGRPMEVEAVIGAVVELGERLGVPMPSTRVVYACAKLLDEKRAQRAGVQSQRPQEAAR
jgi:acyl-CoA synthetase (AMP-forming)/AMP-acid ligase II